MASTEFLNQPDAQAWAAELSEADKRAIAKTTRKLATARRLATQSTTDLQIAVRERGRADARLAGARSAFGVAQIPMGACVEIELIAEVQ